MASPEIDTHNLVIDFGKYKGEPWTRIPVSYLKWLANESGDKAEIARAELARRGTLVEYEIEITGHAIDRASLNCRHIWHQTALNYDEGLHSWLHRMASEALSEYGRHESVQHRGLKFIFIFGELYPTLKTVMPGKPNRQDGPIIRQET